MQEFTGTEYTKIAVANAFGLDKELFEDRIEWVEDHRDTLASLIHQADEPAIFLSGLQALYAAEQGNPSGFMVGLDACSSGIQLMGALMGCEVTCENTGLVDPDVRADIYTTTTDVMNSELTKQGIAVAPKRSEIKDALMTHFYGSKAKPEEIFGEDTDELHCFYNSLNKVAPGAVVAMEHLLAAWQPYALEHRWTLPDGFEAVVPVMEAVDFKVEVDELNHATFTHRIFENIGTETGLSIAANVIHSIDGMVVREMNRRCNYDKEVLLRAYNKITRRIAGRSITPTTDFVSLRLAEDISSCEVDCADVDEGVLIVLVDLILKVLEHKSFPIVCVHDEFKCHPNNMNQLRKHYISIFAELSRTNLLADILAQIHGVPTYNLPKLGKVDHLIEKANYPLS